MSNVGHVCCGNCAKWKEEQDKQGEAQLRISTSNRATLRGAGEVITFARGFIPAVFSDYVLSDGPYCVRASASGVYAAASEITDEPALEELIAALHMAWAEHQRMKGGRG